MSTFGERLKHLREARGWTQQELAERSQVPYITIYRCERGQHQEPRVGVAAKLARALGVSKISSGTAGSGPAPPSVHFPVSGRWPHIRSIRPIFSTVSTSS